MKKLLGLAAIITSLVSPHAADIGEIEIQNHKAKTKQTTKISIGIRMQLMAYRMLHLDVEEEIDERRDELLAEIEEILDDRRGEIDTLATEKFYTFGCADQNGRRYSSDQILNRILLSRINYDSSLGSNPEELERLLTELSEDTIDIDEKQSTIASFSSEGRYLEECLGEKGNGTFDIYGDYLATFRNGDCETAATLARVLEDHEREFDVIRGCTKPGDPADPGTGVDEFYRVVATLTSDEILTISAHHVPIEEYSRWREVCTRNRFSRGALYEIAFASCIRDLLFGGRSLTCPSAHTLGTTNDYLAQLIPTLPPDDYETRCSLSLVRDHGGMTGQGPIFYLLDSCLDLNRHN